MGRLPLVLALLLLSSLRVLSAPIIPLAGTDRVTVKLTPASGYVAGTGLHYQIRHWPENDELVGGFIGPEQIRQDGAGFPMFEVTGLHPKLWSPQDPQLYRISVSTEDGRLLGTVRFGFRTFEVKDRRFLLNGRPIFLRSVPINPPGRDLPAEAGTDPEFIRGYLRLLKSAGVNMIRTDTQPWLDACDELGLMTLQGQYGPAPYSRDGNPPPVEKARDRYREIISNLAAHPSVVIYVLTNETDRVKFKDFLEATRADVALLDPTRPVIGNAGFGQGEGGEIYDIHPYYGWYHGNLNDWYALSDAVARADAAGKPLTISECVAAYTADSGDYLTMAKQMSTMLRWIGPSPQPAADAQEYQAELVRQVVEVSRRLRTEKSWVAGVMPFTYFLGWANARKPGDLIEKPAFKTLRTVFQPILISPECWTRNLYAGDKLSLRLCVANDDDDGQALKQSRADVEIVSPSGKIVAAASVDFPEIPYYSNQWRSLTIPLPASLPKGDYQVRCRLVRGGKLVSSNSFGIFVAPRDWAQTKGLRVALFDPSGETVRALRGLGIVAERVSSLKKLPAKGVLVIGEEALAKEAPDRADAHRFLEAGGRIVCLAQSHHGRPLDWLPAKIIMSTGRSYSYIHPVGDNARLFEGLRERDLRCWNSLGKTSNGAPDICPVPAIYRPQGLEELRDMRVWASTGQILSAAAVMEVFHGKGSVILSQFRCAERAATDPVAARMLANTIRYACSNGHPDAVDLSEPIRWDLSAIRRGAFVSQLQGFLPHSKTYQHRGSSKGMLGADHRIDGFTVVGSYTFRSTGWIEPIPDPAAEGWGILYGKLTRPATEVGLKVHNTAAAPARIRVKLDGKEIGDPATLQPGEEREVTWPITRRPGPVQFEVRGDQTIVITESWFR